MTEYIVSVDYSTLTGLRYCTESDCSGEDFYHTRLNAWFKDALDRQEQIKIILDGGEDGYGPSFRDEAFGNLVFDFSRAEVEKWLVIVAPGDDLWKEEIESDTYKDWEDRRVKGENPKKTIDHPAWFRKTSSGIEQKVWINKSE